MSPSSHLYLCPPPFLSSLGVNQRVSIYPADFLSCAARTVPLIDSGLLIVTRLNRCNRSPASWCCFHLMVALASNGPNVHTLCESGTVDTTTSYETRLVSPLRALAGSVSWPNSLSSRFVSQSAHRFVSSVQISGRHVFLDPSPGSCH